MKTTTKQINTTNTTASWLSVIALAVGLGLVVAPSVALAADTYQSKLNQSITAGALSTDIRNSSGGVVSSPSFAMGSVPVSNTMQTSTGTFGSSAQRISVDNPSGANNGWALSLAATNPTSAKWVSGSNNYDYKGTAAAGQLTVNPSAATITPVVGTATGVTKGTSSSFSGSGSAITLMQAGTTADKIWNGYMTGVGLSQTIPASQPVGTYSIDMTQTVVAQ